MLKLLQKIFFRNVDNDEPTAIIDDVATTRPMYAIKVGNQTLAHYSSYLEACVMAAKKFEPGTFKIVYEK